MKALLLGLLITSVSAHAVCNKKVDPNKVILFVDTNDSEMEIDTAEKAACDRGERVVVVPKNYKDYAKYTSAVKRLGNEAKNCNSGTQSRNCAEVMKKYYDARTALEEFKGKQPAIRKSIQASLKELKDSKVKVQSLVISGHDGGGNFGGDKGSFSRHDFAEVLKDLEGINEIKSLLLLGCYTGVQKEVNEWKKLLPEVRLIAGYDDSAPLSTRPGGHKYLTDLLTKEKDLLKQADQKRLQSFVEQNLASMYSLNSAMYMQCSDGEKKEYYYGSKRKTRKFSPIDMKICQNKDDIEMLMTKSSAYFSGDLEVPKDTARGELRQLYNLARSMEHCFDEEDGEAQVDVHQIFNLLFYEGVKKSFAAFYKDDLATVENELSKLSFEDVLKSSEATLKEEEAKIKAEEDLLVLLKTNPEGYKKIIEDRAKAVQAELKALKEGAEYLRIKAKIEGGREPSPEESKYLRKTNSLAYQDFLLRDKLNVLKDDHDSLISSSQRTIQLKKEDLHPIREQVEKLRANPNLLKNIWVPTDKNLSVKTRKETLENLHQIHGLLASAALPPKLFNQLFWVQKVSTRHLQHFENPFSWHEYNGHSVEAPEEVRRLREFEELNEN